MTKEFTILIEKGIDGFYVGSTIELPGCHTQGETIDELMKNIKEAIELYLAVRPELKEQASEFVGIQRLYV